MSQLANGQKKIIQEILSYEVIRLLQIDINNNVRYFNTVVRSPSGKYAVINSEYTLIHDNNTELQFILQRLLYSKFFINFDFNSLVGVNDFIICNVDNLSDSALIKSIRDNKVQPISIELELGYYEILEHIRYYFSHMDAGLKTELISRLLVRLWNDSYIVVAGRQFPSVKSFSINGHKFSLGTNPVMPKHWEQINKAIYDNMKLLDEIEDFVISLVLNNLIDRYGHLI